MDPEAPQRRVIDLHGSCDYGAMVRTTRSLSLSLSLSLLGTLAAGCATDDGDEASNEEAEGAEGAEGEPEIPEVRSESPHDDNPQIDASEQAALSEDAHALSLDLYHLLRTQRVGEGFSISSYSIQTAFGMLYGGTVGQARDEMTDTLHFSLEDRQHLALNWLDAQITARNLPGYPDQEIDPVITQVANGVWVTDSLGPSVEPEYLDLLSIHYDAGLFLADFVNHEEEERMRINGWVSARTRDLIPELFPKGSIQASTTMVLVNALYLKAPWAEPFDPNATSKQSFTRVDGSTVMVDMMRSYMQSVDYAEGEGWFAVSVPLRGGALGLLAIVPDDFAAFEASLDLSTLDAVTSNLAPELVTLALPKFTLESSFELGSVLRDELGMPTPFMDPSSFDGIVLGGPGVITRVIHKTVIAVDEKGTEAAAATGIVLGDDGGPSPTRDIVVDKPFLLILRDGPTNTPLFFGRVLDPSA